MQAVSASQLTAGASLLTGLGSVLTSDDVECAPCSPCNTVITLFPTVQLDWPAGRTAIVASTIHPGSPSQDAQEMLQLFTKQLIAFGWIVVGSCDAVTFGNDGVDRLLVYSQWRTIGPNKPWLTLRDGNGAEVSFWLEIWSNDSGGFITVHISYAPGGGFTGGTLTAQPTAPTGGGFSTATALFNGGSPGIGGVHRMVCNMICTPDVKHTRAWFYDNGVCFDFCAFETARDPVPGWTLPQFGLWDAGGNNPNSPVRAISTIVNIDNASTAAFPVMRGWSPVAGGQFMPLFPSIEGRTIANSLNPQQFTGVNAISGVYELAPSPSLGSFNAYGTSGNDGRHGWWADVWGIPAGITQGSMWPPASVGSNFRAFGQLVVPWPAADPAPVIA